MNNTEQAKDALQLFCPNRDCPARGKIGAGNLLSHGKKRERYKCKMCGKTFCAREGTILVVLQKIVENRDEHEVPIHVPFKQLL